MKNFTQKFIGLLALVFTISFTANSQEIGDIYQGGIVFYVDETGLHGLVADMQNLEPLTWGCMATSLDGAGGQAMGTGYQNTLDIVAGCSEIPIAASEALAYESEGYSDWYLPSQDELIEIYNTIGPGGPEGDIAGFGHSGEETLNWYWSSSESNMFNAWRVYFGNGLTYVGDKNLAYKVRVIRSVTFEAEVPGCTDPDALNYDSTATQATACFYDCTDAVAMDGSASSSTGENSWHSFDIAADGSALVSLDTDFDFPENISISLFADCEGTYVSCAGTELVDDLIWACEGDFAAGTYYVNVTSYPLELGSADYTLSVSMSIEGCTDAVAVNYDATATVDDGSCILPVYGCTGPSHCNYNPDATVDDGSCVYAMEGYDCDGNCLLEVDCMGECGGSAIEDECGECGGNGLDSPDITNGLCDCEGNQWEEYCYDNDGDGLGDISTVAWFCPSSIEDGYILNCDDTDDTFGCTDIIVNVINSDSTSYHSFGMSIEDENGVFDYLGFGQRNYCIEPGCFAFYIYDTNDSIGGFEHVQLLVTDINNTIYLDHSFGVSNSEIINFSYGDVDCSYGCTSIFASNYNPEATVNDGSCEYENDNCTDGQISDCNENCTPSTWYSDGWCDDGAYSFGGNYIDLTCFDNDGGDCEEITDDSILGTWEIFSWYEEGEEVLNEDFNGYFNFNDSGEFTLTVINEEEGYFIDQGVYEITGDTLMILPDSHDEDESLYFSFDLENGELSMFGINVDIAIQMSSTETIWSCIDPNNPNYHPEANMMDYTCIEGCFDENACNYGEEEDCYYPEGDCDCEGDGVDYSNVGFEVNMDGMELSDSSYVYISGFWHDSTSTSDIHIELGHGWDNVYVGDYDGPPGASFSYYVVVDGQQYGNCDGNAYSIGFPDLDQEHPCWVHNNTNWIEPFNCGEITDCNGPQYTGQQWIDQAEYLIGDGNCDSEDGWSFNFNCDEFDFEGGDCINDNDCSDAYNDGWNNGEENGWNNGYDVGYAEGYNNGEDDLDAANEALAGAQYSAEYFAEMYLVADSIAEAIASDLAATQDSLAATQAALGNYNLLQGELAAANAVAADLEAQLVAAQEACEPIFIDLLEGWNMIGYTLSEEQDVAATLEDISSELILVKNNEGDIYWLEFGFNGIGNFIPGQGYQAKLISSIPNYTYLIVGDQKLELTPQVPQWVFDIEVDVHPNDVRTLVRVVNMLGQEVDPENQTRGTVLLYLYNDATVEKKMIN